MYYYTYYITYYKFLNSTQNSTQINYASVTRAKYCANIKMSAKIIATGEICIADDTFAIRVIEVK